MGQRSQRPDKHSGLGVAHLVILGMDEMPLLHPKAAPGLANKLRIYKEGRPNRKARSTD